MSKFGTTQEPSTVQTGMQGSISTPGGQAEAVLESLKNPLAEAAGVVKNTMPAGYYSANCTNVVIKGKKVLGKKIGGRFFFPEKDLDEEATKRLKTLVDAGVAYYESGDTAE